MSKKSFLIKTFLWLAVFALALGGIVFAAAKENPTLARFAQAAVAPAITYGVELSGLSSAVEDEVLWGQPSEVGSTPAANEPNSQSISQGFDTLITPPTSVEENMQTPGPKVPGPQEPVLEQPKVQEPDPKGPGIGADKPTPQAPGTQSKGPGVQSSCVQTPCTEEHHPHGLTTRPSEAILPHAVTPPAP